MLDINYLEENLEYVKNQINKRGMDYSDKLISLVSLNKQRKLNIQEVENLKSEKNKISKEIGILVREDKKTEVEKLKEKMSSMNEKIDFLDSKLNSILNDINKINLEIPNIPNEKMPFGKDEEENVEIRKWNDKELKKDSLAHWEIATKLKLINFEYGAKISGSRFVTYTGEGSKMVRYIADILLREHEKRNYKEFFLPLLVNEENMYGTGQLPKFEDDAYKIDNQFLIPTAEVPLTNICRDQILDCKELPIKLTSFTQCFRKESGSAGKDTRGIIRLHQFNKVELVKIVHPDESYKELETMTDDAENILKLFNLPYRVIELCTGDVGFASAKTYDIEVWFPNQNKYREISSCSNCLDFQARRMNARFKDKDEKTKLLHTLNGSALAIDRLIAAILENYYDGEKLVLPEVLKSYYGKDYLE